MQKTLIKKGIKRYKKKSCYKFIKANKVFNLEKFQHFTKNPIATSRTDHKRHIVFLRSKNKGGGLYCHRIFCYLH